MKNRKRLKQAVVLWLGSVIVMNVLLLMAFFSYRSLKQDVDLIKEENTKWKMQLAEIEQQYESQLEKMVVLSAKEDSNITGDSYELTNVEVEEETASSETTASEVSEAETTDSVVKEAETTEAETTEAENTGTEIIEAPVKDTSILFAGDLLLSGAILRQYNNSDNLITGLVCESLLERMNTAEIFMVNQEFPFSDRGTAMEDKEYTFRAPVDKVNILHEMGIDIVSLANNHTLDYGIDALVDTFETLDNADVLYVGAGENLDRAKKLETIDVNGVRFGFLAASRVIPVTNWNATDTKAGMLTTYNPTALIAEIEAADDQCDVLIVYVHWGIEYNEYPEDYQVIMAHQYIDAGADVVVGSHPHVVQGFEYYKDKLIAYSLGNFVFGNTIKQGMLLQVTQKADGTVGAEVLPYYSPKFTLMEMEESTELEFYEYLTTISDGVRVDENGMLHKTSE